MAKQKVSIEEIERRKIQNEEEIKKCFSTTSCFWGIDSVILRLDSRIVFNDTVIGAYERNNKDNVKINRDYRGNIDFIDVKSKEFGRLSIGYLPYSKKKQYCHLQLNHVGLNVETASQNEIISRLQRVLTHIDENLGIFIEVTGVHYKKIELAFTYASKQDIHPQLAALLIRSLTGDTQVNFNTSKIKDRNGAHPIVSSRKKNNRTLTHYNKTLKAIANRQIRNDQTSNVSHPLRVNRLEICLQDSAIKIAFGTSDLFQISDSKIIQYIEGVVSVGICKFIREYRDSISKTEQLLKLAMTESGQQGYMPIFFANQLNKALNSAAPLTLDEEIFCFVKIKGLKNLSRTKRRLIEKSQSFSITNKESYFLSLMLTWYCIRIFRLMFDSLDYAKQVGLGCIQNSNSRSLHSINLASYAIEEKTKVFEEIIAANQKNKKRNIEKHIIEKLMNLESELF